MIMKKKVVKTTNTPTPKKENTSTTKTPVRTVTPSVITHEGDSMRDLFFIIKGQYRKGLEPSFMNKVSGEVSHIGGYDPYSKDTENWYMLVDKITFQCMSCGSDLEKVVKGVYTAIVKRKGSAKKYFKHVSDTTSDDYYETHYLGRTPLNHDQRQKKAEGRCPRVSPIMRELYSAIYHEYGDFYRDLIEEQEDRAYHDLEEWVKENKPINKTKKRLAKTKIQKTEMETPRNSVVKTTEKVVKPKVKLGVKKLSLTS